MSTPASMPVFSLERNQRGRLVCTLADGTRREDVVPVRAYPLSAPNDGVAIMGADGHEVLWIARLDAVPERERAVIEAELAAREFVPVIERLLGVSTFSTPSTWTVATDRGETKFTLKGEEDIRRLPNGALLITDSHGVGYRVRDRFALDRHSRKLIERFL
ncbi:MAG: DUF1854 domain-containing protein [Planctomycetota bacterium]|nr:DUF1854 domain-containing protein [Planctomycetota bacterium]